MTGADTVVSAKSLYETSGVFRAGIGKWVVDRRCPVELGDFLEEHGLVSQADCARWCASQPDRPVWPGGDQDTDKTPCGPFPHSWVCLGWMWTAQEGVPREYADRVPREKMVNDDDIYLMECPEALLWLLDNWRV